MTSRRLFFFLTLLGSSFSWPADISNPSNPAVFSRVAEMPPPNDAVPPAIAPRRRPTVKISPLPESVVERADSSRAFGSAPLAMPNKPAEASEDDGGPTSERPLRGRSITDVARDSFTPGWSAQFFGGLIGGVRENVEAAPLQFNALAGDAANRNFLAPLAGGGAWYGIKSPRTRFFLVLSGSGGESLAALLNYGIDLYFYPWLRTTLASGQVVLENRLWEQPFLPTEQRTLTRLQLRNLIRASLGVGGELFSLTYTAYNEAIEHDVLGADYPTLARDGHVTQWDIRGKVPVYVPPPALREQQPILFADLRYNRSSRRALGAASSSTTDSGEVGLGLVWGKNVGLLSGGYAQDHFDAPNPYPDFLGITRRDTARTLNLLYLRQSLFDSPWRLLMRISSSKTTSNIDYYRQSGTVGLWLFERKF